MNRKNNRHYEETHRLIQQSMLLLLEKKNLEDISVREICTLARINPSTFYAHYDSIYTLLGTIDSILKEEHIRFFDAEAIQWRYFWRADGLTAVLRYIKAHRRFYRAYIGRMNGLPYIQAIFEELWTTNEKENFWESVRGRDETEILFTLVMGGALKVIELWLNRDCIDDEAQLAQTLSTFVPPELQSA